MLKVKLVTAYVPLNVKHLDRDAYKALGKKLVDAVGPDNIRVFDDFPLEKCMFYPLVSHPHADHRLYPDRYDDPSEMSRSSIVQHNRTSWAMMASREEPDVDVWVWVDYGIMKQGDFTGRPVRAESIRNFLAKVATGSVDDLPFPGIWNHVKVGDHEADWRFCGSLHIWPKKLLGMVHMTYCTEVSNFFQRTGKLPYDMTIWHAVERAGGLPFRWYAANHDDTQFTNYSPRHGQTRLCELAFKYGTDKAAPAGYTPVYFDLLNGKKVKKVLEIGICAKRDIPNHRTGASLWMWADFFPDAEIIGVDIDPASMVNEGRIKSYVCDQSSRMAMAELLYPMAPFDLIVDDGSHNPVHQLVTMTTLLPTLASDGIYVIEDIGNWQYPSTRPDDFIKQLPSGYTANVYGELPHQLMVIRRG